MQTHLSCSASRCVAVHPGYGFLSENAEFVEEIERAGISFLGPTADTMRMFSRKHTAREFAISAEVPVLPGVPLPNSRCNIFPGSIESTAAESACD